MPTQERKGRPDGAAIARLRAGRDWTQVELAALAGLSPATIASLEQGRYATTSSAVLAPLAAALGCQVEDLLT